MSCILGCFRCCLQPLSAHPRFSQPPERVAKSAHPRFLQRRARAPATVVQPRALKIALIQLAVGPDKATNIAAAVSEIHKAKEKGAQLVVLPEFFNSPYGTKSKMWEYAERVPSGETCVALSKAAADTGMYIVGGTITEKTDLWLANTCIVFDDEGEPIVIHRKEILGKEISKSEELPIENRITTFYYGPLNIGIGICDELRVFETAALIPICGCSLLIYPGAFDETIGSKHWDMIARARANELHLWVALVSRASDTKPRGHSMLIDPRGEVVASLDKEAGTLHGSINLKMVKKVRRKVPVSRSEERDNDTEEKRSTTTKRLRNLGKTCRSCF